MAAAIVDLPTPPFPEPTAITFLMPGMSPVSVMPLPRTSAPMVMFSFHSPGSRFCKAVRTSRSICALRGQAGVVRLTVSATVPSLIRTSLIIPRSTKSRPRSGSLTPLSAWNTSRSVSVGLVLPNIERDSPAGVPPSRVDGSSYFLRVFYSSHSERTSQAGATRRRETPGARDSADADEQGRRGEALEEKLRRDPTRPRSRPRLGIGRDASLQSRRARGVQNSVGRVERPEHWLERRRWGERSWLELVGLT